MGDLEKEIEIIRQGLHPDDSESFEKIIDRLEGYELAYGVVMRVNEDLKKMVEKLNEDIQIVTRHRDKLGESNVEYQKALEQRGEIQ